MMLKEILVAQHNSTYDLKELLENQKEESSTSKEQSTKINSIWEIQKEIAADQRKMADNQVNVALISEELAAKTSEANELQKKLNSEEGKRGAVTRKLNQERDKVAEMEAQKQAAIGNAEIIDAVTKEIRRQTQETQAKIITEVKQQGKRARKQQERLALHGARLCYLRGDPGDDSPYDRWMDENWYTKHYKEFKTNLEKNYKEAKVMTKRADLPPCADFPESAKIRLFEYGLGVVLSSGNVVDLDNSPAKHMYNLALLSGSIFREDIVEEIITTMEIQVEFFCKKLSIPYAKDTTTYPHIDGDAFLGPEVSASLPCSCWA